MAVAWRKSVITQLLLLGALLLSRAAAAPATPAGSSYLAAHGAQHQAVADRLAELLGAEEPLLPDDVARLTTAVKRACVSAPSQHPPAHQLSAADLLHAYGRAPGVLDQRALEQACTAIMACQLDETCSLADGAGAAELDTGARVTGALRLGAALALFLEGLAGVYIPVLLKSVQGYEWWLSLLNCFSGGVFLAAGLVHLLPHCAEAQARLGHIVGDYPLYLVLICLGYMLVLFVERVLFDVHGSAHGHGPHTGVPAPCVDCISAEAAAELHAAAAAAAGSGGSSEAGGSQHGGGAAAAQAAGGRGANGAAPLTPGGGRYNLRSRAREPLGADGGGDGAGLAKPLLADAPEAGAGAAGSSSGGGCGHAHHGHAHGHGHGLEGSGGHGSAGVPSHHHAVVTGDLRQGVVLLVAMSVHTFLECMALGLMDLRKEFIMLFIAIASHKLISGLALSSRFLKEGATTRQITTCVGPFVFVAPTAILAGMFVADVHPLVHLALSCFATGTFLYVGASEIVEEEFEGDMRSGRTDISQVFARWCKFGMLLLGVGAIALLSLVPDAHDHGHGHGHGHGHAHHH